MVAEGVATTIGARVTVADGVGATEALLVAVAEGVATGLGDVVV
jgi:hypothetical protein